MSKKLIAWRQAGLVRQHKRAVGTPLISLGACSGGKFVVSRAGRSVCEGLKSKLEVLDKIRNPMLIRSAVGAAMRSGPFAARFLVCDLIKTARR